MRTTKQEKTVAKIGKEQNKLDSLKAKMDALAEEMKSKEKEIAALKEQQRIQTALELLDAIEKSGLTADTVKKAVVSKDFYGLQEQVEKSDSKANATTVDTEEETEDLNEEKAE